MMKCATIILALVYACLAAGAGPPALFDSCAMAQPGAPPGGPSAGGQGEAASTTETISAIGFTGNEAFGEEALLGATGLRVGDVMSPEIIGTAIERLVAFYREGGANLSVSPNITPNNGRPIIEFVIDESGTRGNAGAFEPGGGRAGGAFPAGTPGDGPPPSGVRK